MACPASWKAIAKKKIGINSRANSTTEIFDKPDEIKQSAMVNRVGRPRKSVVVN